MPVWLKWSLSIFASIFAYGLSKGAYDLVRLPDFLKKVCRDAPFLKKLAEEKGYRPDNRTVVAMAGYQKVIEIDIMSSIQAWRRGKYLPICLFFIIFALTTFLLGPKYQIPIYVALVLSVLGDGSSRAKQDVVNLVRRLQSVVDEWREADPIACKAYCVGPGKEYVGNMYLVSSAMNEPVR